MSGICEGRVVIITGAARGIGREHALEFSRQGAKVVVNDLGGGVDGSGKTLAPAQEVVDEIRTLGGEAIANGEDVSDWDGAKRLIDAAVEHFGRLDILVNNAGILRDRMLVNMTPEEWDDVIKVHLRGTFAPTRHAVNYWRTRGKAGEDVDARIINTSSASGLYGNVGQTNYGAAKAGIASFTLIAAQELSRANITVNAVAPAAITRMTAHLASTQARDAEDVAKRGAEYVSPIVVWLGSEEARGVTGYVFNSVGGHLSVAEGWVEGPVADTDGRWDPAGLGPVVEKLVSQARQGSDITGRPRSLHA